MNKNLQSSMRCPNCGSTDLAYFEENGTLVCEKCGLVIEENPLSTEEERRYFSSQEKIMFRRVTTPKQQIYLNVGQHSIRIRISNDRFFYSNRLQRDLNMCRDYIKDFAGKLRLSDSIKNESLRIIAKYISKKHVTKKDAPYVVSAAIFIALRNSGSYRPLDRFLRNLGLSKKKFSKIYKSLRELVKISVKLPSAEDYVHIFAKDLQLSSTCMKIAIDVLKRVKMARFIMTKNAASLAAAAIYYASIITGEKRSRRRIAAIAATTESTIKNRYNEIISILNSFNSK